jgi:hypothetical protein
MTERKPLLEEELRVTAAALAAHPRMIVPDDEEMAETCTGLVERGLLIAVREGDREALDPMTDEVVGYRASDALRVAAAQLAARN